MGLRNKICCLCGILGENGLQQLVRPCDFLIELCPFALLNGALELVVDLTVGDGDHLGARIVCGIAQMDQQRENIAPRLDLRKVIGKGR